MAIDQIDELIEESYLLSLPEQDVRSHLQVFLDACEMVLKQDSAVRRDLRIVGVKVALLRAKFLLNSKSQPSQSDESLKSADPGQKLIQQIMQTKRLVRRLLGGVDSSLLAALEREEKRLREHTGKGKAALSWHAFSGAVGYYSILLSILLMLLLYLGQ